MTDSQLSCLDAASVVVRAVEMLFLLTVCTSIQSFESHIYAVHTPSLQAPRLYAISIDMFYHFYASRHKTPSTLGIVLSYYMFTTHLVLHAHAL